MDALIEKLKSIKHGFKHIIEAGDLILQDPSIDHLEFGTNLLEYDAYQIRMLATYLFGQLSVKNSNALEILETRIATDNNWRVQEMLAKAFDHYCQTVGYEKSLTKIKSWINGKDPNLKRAVIEGLRIWTNRPYFKENPELAIQLIAKARFDDSEYVRRSIGNSVRDISKKHKVLVDNEVSNWSLADKKIMFIQKLIYK